MSEVFLEVSVNDAVLPVTVQMDPVIHVKVSPDSVTAVLSTSQVVIPVSVIGSSSGATIVMPDPELEARVDDIEDGLGDTGKDFAGHFTSLIV
jgi:hypothetical protein